MSRFRTIKQANIEWDIEDRAVAILWDLPKRKRDHLAAAIECFYLTEVYFVEIGMRERRSRRSVYLFSEADFELANSRLQRFSSDELPLDLMANLHRIFREVSPHVAAKVAVTVARQTFARP